MDKKPTTTEFTAQQPNPVRQARLHRHRGREDSLKQPEKHVIADKFAQRAAKVVCFAGLDVVPSKKRIQSPDTQCIKGGRGAENIVLSVAKHPQKAPQ
jgi:hypothetical protein